MSRITGRFTTLTLFLMVAFPPSSPASAATLVVAFPMIQSAVDAANPGDRIKILSGTYVPGARDMRGSAFTS